MAPPRTLWYTRCPVPSPLGIAARLGWLEARFARLGLTVESVIDSPVRSIRESHFDHHLPWSFRQGGNIPPIWARSRGARTRLIALTWTDEFQALIGLPGAGPDSADGLRGRRIAVPRRVNDQVDFHRATALKGVWSALATVGLGLDDVEPVDLPIEESVIVGVGEPSLFGLRRRHPYFRELRALVQGEVDAIFVKGAEGILIANLIGARVIVETGRHPDPTIRINNGTPRLLTVDDALATERPDLVIELLRLVDEAGDWAAAHPDETLRFVAREIGSTEEAVLASNGPRVNEHLRIGLDPAHIQAIGRFKTLLLEWGVLPADFAIDTWLDPAPLTSLRAAVPA